MYEENQTLEAAAASAEPYQANNEPQPEKSIAESDFDKFFERNSDKVKQALAALMNEQAAPMGVQETEPEINSAADTQPSEINMKADTLVSKERELAELERQLNQKKLQFDTVKLLEAFDLPTNIAELVIGSDMRETKKNVDMFRIAFDKAVQERVSERLRGRTPDSGNIIPSSPTGAARKAIREVMNGRR